MNPSDPNYKPSPSGFERFNKRMKNSISVRLFFIVILSLLLLIPAGMVEDMIRDREWRRTEVIQSINSSWGGQQSIIGPVMTIPYLSHTRAADGKILTTRHQAHFLPEQLDIEGSIAPEVRNISLFESVVYGSELDIKGHFDYPDFSDWRIAEDDIEWDEAFISMGVSDMRGIQERIAVDWDGEEFVLGPGTDDRDVVGTGVSTKVPLGSDSTNTGFDFSMKMNFNGSERLYFYPIGEETNLKLQSSWPHPGFEGAFLPDDRNISETGDGFDATWKVLSLNRNYPQSWLNSDHSISGSGFGLQLVTPVDDYQKSTRAVKYALMLIAFTFLIFFFLEVKSGKRVHPIQFILVGLALIVFYTLLISLSEHFGFNVAYLISAVAVTVLIATYFQAIFKSKGMTALLIGVMAVMYGFIFTTLQLQDYALLIGSIGLFVTLALVMMLSRKVDWYRLSSSED